MEIGNIFIWNHSNKGSLYYEIVSKNEKKTKEWGQLTMNVELIYSENSQYIVGYTTTCTTTSFNDKVVQRVK